MLDKSRGSPPAAAGPPIPIPPGLLGRTRAVAEFSAERMRNESTSDRLRGVSGSIGVAFLFDAELFAARAFTPAARRIPRTAPQDALAGSHPRLPAGADFPE